MLKFIKKDIYSKIEETARKNFRNRIKKRKGLTIKDDTVYDLQNTYHYYRTRKSVSEAQKVYASAWISSFKSLKRKFKNKIDFTRFNEFKFSKQKKSKKYTNVKHFDNKKTELKINEAIKLKPGDIIEEHKVGNRKYAIQLSQDKDGDNIPRLYIYPIISGEIRFDKMKWFNARNITANDEKYLSKLNIDPSWRRMFR